MLLQQGMTNLLLQQLINIVHFQPAAYAEIAALENGRNYIGVVKKQEEATEIRRKIDEMAAQNESDEEGSVEENI